ncbi:venom protein 302-like isoform X2 [Gordionus sp. m RMFG-2023]|uniref:venom protein 302-like isoform X2 n=1 Tax=Gordionus sp. m RMFG-2023 TaxID=3053472 RepID=UPI0031FBE581
MISLKILCLLLLGIIWSTTRYIEGLSCTCHQMEGKCNSPPPTNCKGDMVKDACGCCDVCAKKLGDPCGTNWQQGNCTQGLKCDQASPGNIGECKSE